MKKNTAHAIRCQKCKIPIFQVLPHVTASSLSDRSIAEKLFNFFSLPSLQLIIEHSAFLLQLLRVLFPFVFKQSRLRHHSSDTQIQGLFAVICNQSVLTVYQHFPHSGRIRCADSGPAPQPQQRRLPLNWSRRKDHI